MGRSVVKCSQSTLPWMHKFASAVRRRPQTHFEIVIGSDMAAGLHSNVVAVCEVMAMDLECGHKGPTDLRANYLWCDTCRRWVRVEKREKA